MTLSTRSIALLSVLLLFGAVVAIPQSALAIGCTQPCGIGQTCDTSTGTCMNPATPSNNSPLVTQPATSGGSGTSIVNPLKNISDLSSLLKAVLGALIKVGTVVLILAFIWIGFSFVRAQGKPEELKKARAAFVWTIIGGAILLGAQGIADVIQSTVTSLGS